MRCHIASKQVILFMTSFRKRWKLMQIPNISGLTLVPRNIMCMFELAAFAKLKSILSSPKTKLNLKISLFKAACVSILFNDCETCILTDAFTEKLDMFARTCYRIMLGINQSRDHVTNERLNQGVNQVPISEMILERQLKFTGHCILMPTDEPVNSFVLSKTI